MSHRPQRSAARHALEAIHRYYGVEKGNHAMPQKKKEEKKAVTQSITQSEKNDFLAEIVKKIKKSEDATTMGERRGIYIEIFEYIVDHKEILHYYPTLRVLLTEKIREFEETIRKQVIQFPASYIYTQIHTLRYKTATISNVYKDMEKNYQDKLRELEGVVEKYHSMLMAGDVRKAMENLKRVLAEVNQST
jgi:predicted ATP-binding protein involved in virulence